MTGKIYFNVLVSRCDEKKKDSEQKYAFPKFNVLLISSSMQFGLLLLFPNIWTLPHFLRIYWWSVMILSHYG